MGVFMKFLVSLLLVLTGLNSAYAGGCNLEEVKPTQHLASLHLAYKTRQKILEIEKEMAAKGQELQVVMVATPSPRMKKMHVIHDDFSKDLQSYLLDLAAISRSDHKDRKRLPILPKSYYDTKNPLEFSHFGFVVKHSHENPNANTWTTAYHLLAQCDKSKNRYGMSDILFEPYHEFYWNSDLMKRKKRKFPNAKTLLVVPSVKIQERLMEEFQISGRPGDTLHEPRYNVIATPYKLQSWRDFRKGKRAEPIHQLTDMNSNQWLLEVIAAAQKPHGMITTRKQAQDQLWETNYHPSLLRPKGIMEFNACAVKKGPFGIWDATNILQCKDQAFKPEFIVQIITAKSMVRYMEKENLLARNDDGTPRVHKIYGDKDLLNALRPLDKLKTKKDKRTGERYKTLPDIDVIQKVQEAVIGAGLGGDSAETFVRMYLNTNKEIRIRRTNARR